MNKISKIKSILILLTLSTFIFSCSSDDNAEIEGGSEETSFNLIVNTTNAAITAERDLTITAAPNALQKVNVTFMAENSMKRLYIAKVEDGGAIVPFVFEDAGVTVDNKKDGSLDLVGDNKKDFTFNIDFPTPSSVDGTITYLLWATTGRGDFRDVSKRNAIGEFDFGTITIKAGNGAVGDGVKSFSGVLLAAPLESEKSESFISLFNNTIYRIDQGEEYAAFWDFGYYYGVNGNASFASAFDYPKSVIDIPAITGLASSELNNFFIAKSNADFDTVTKREDLNNITKPTAETITNLADNDILEFVDSYGNKGLIKVTKIVPGNGSDGKITFDVKVQTSDLTIKQ